jgi:hypothetical protein
MNEVFIDQRTLLHPVVLSPRFLQLLHQSLAPPAAAGDAQQQPSSSSVIGEVPTTALLPSPSCSPAATASATSHFDNHDNGSGGGIHICWKQLYLGSSVSSICSNMTASDLHSFFTAGCMCIRSYDPSTGAVSVRLPTYLTATATSQRHAVLINGAEKQLFSHAAGI